MNYIPLSPHSVCAGDSLQHVAGLLPLTTSGDPDKVSHVRSQLLSHVTLM